MMPGCEWQPHAPPDRTDEVDPHVVLTAALWGDVSNDGRGGVDAGKLARRLIDTLADAGFSVVRTGPSRPRG